MKLLLAAILIMVCLGSLVAAQIEIIDADSTWNASTYSTTDLEETVADDEQLRIYTDYSDSIEYTNSIVISTILQDLLELANPRIKTENINSITTILIQPFPEIVELVLRPIVIKHQSQKLTKLQFDNTLCVPLNDTRSPEITNITLTIV